MSSRRALRFAPVESGQRLSPKSANRTTSGDAPDSCASASAKRLRSRRPPYRIGCARLSNGCRAERTSSDPAAGESSATMISGIRPWCWQLARKLSRHATRLGARLHVTTPTAPMVPESGRSIALWYATRRGFHCRPPRASLAGLLAVKDARGRTAGHVGRDSSGRRAGKNRRCAAATIRTFSDSSRPPSRLRRYGGHHPSLVSGLR